ncbi:hypothetical protein ABZP36_000175 [Zizania latifolia]
MEWYLMVIVRAINCCGSGGHICPSAPCGAFPVRDCGGSIPQFFLDFDDAFGSCFVAGYLTLTGLGTVHWAATGVLFCPGAHICFVKVTDFVLHKVYFLTIRTKSESDMSTSGS